MDLEKIITSYDEDNKIYIVYKPDGINKKVRRISNYQWHFAIKTSDLSENIERLIKRYPETINNTEIEGNYLKIYAKKKPASFNKYDNIYNLLSELKRNSVFPLEADISLHKRYLLDKKLEVDDNINMLYFDIETDDTLKTIEIGRDRILSFAASDKKGNIFFESGSEKQVLLKFLELVHEYDAICGWNSRDFDLPYIKARLEKYGTSYNWNTRIHVDLMRRLIKLFSPIMGILGLSGFSLDEVGRVFIGQQKIKHDNSIIDMYNNEFEKFKEYNINDVKLTRDIDEKIKATDLMIKECKWTGTLLNRFFIGELLDNYILREAHKLNIYMPSRPDFKDKEKTENVAIRGGFVRTPKTGLYENMRVMDFKSLYPSVIVGWNIGIDSLNQELSLEGDKSFDEFLKIRDKKIEEIEFAEWFNFLQQEKTRLDPEDNHYQTANNNFYKRETTSFIGDLLVNLLNQRKEYKKKLDDLEMGTQEYNSARATQEVVKEMCNCLHPSTFLYVKNTSLNQREYLSIKDIFNSKHLYEIESYNIEKKKTEWKKIKTVMKKEYDGSLLSFDFMHSLDLLCTPEHNFYVSDAKNLDKRKSRDLEIIAFNNKNINKFKSSNVLKSKADEITKETALIFQSQSSTEDRSRKTSEIDIREYIEEPIISSKECLLHYKYSKKGEEIITSNDNFNALIKKARRNLHRKVKSNNEYRGFILLTKEVWLEVKNLTKEDCKKWQLSICPARKSQKIKLIWEIDEKLAWLFGFYVAEGSSGYDKEKNIGGVSITNSENKYRKKVIACFKHLGIRSKDTTSGVDVYSSIVSKVFLNLCYNNVSKKATGKKIPDFIFYQNNNVLKSFITGYVDGDGYKKNRKNRFLAKTVSFQLAHDLANVLRILYKKPVSIRRFEAANENSNTGYTIQQIINNEKSYFKNYYNNISYDTIRNIKEVDYDGEVYDIEVEDNHNFFVSGILISNSMFGICADKTSRYFNKNVAESITLTGQFMNKTSTAIAKKFGYETIYADTDSIFLVINDDEEAGKANDSINDSLKKFLDAKFKLKDNIVYLEYEKKFGRMIMLDKKRYFGNLTWMDGKVIDKVFSRGTEDVKKNTTKYARKKFLELMNYIIKEKRDLPFIKKWLSGVKEEVLTSDKFTADDLMITTKISKPTDAYKSKPTHVRLAEKLIQEGKMLEAKEEKNSWSNRIFYIVTDHENKNEAILAEDFKGQWDRKYYWDVQIYAPIYRVLKVAWPDENWDEHNITFMEKLENKKDREEKKIKRLQELEDKKKEREEKKKVREEEKAKKELEKENKKQLKLI